MKVRLLPLAIGAAIAMPGVALADGPTVYGKMNVTFENSDRDQSYSATDGTNTLSLSDSADTWEWNSNASRLGVKGSEEINSDLSAFYQAEYGIDVDDSGDKPFTQRDIFVGLQGGWGAVKAGKFDSPLKASQGKVDQFNDMSAGDLGNVLAGENRIGNVVQYSSPKVADAVTFNVAVQAGEEYCPTGSASTCQDGPAENFSASVVYSTDMIYAALAVDDGIDGVDATRLTVSANLDAFEVGFLYQAAEESDSIAPTVSPSEQDGFILSAAMKLGSANKIRFQYGSSESDGQVLYFDSYAYDQEVLVANVAGSTLETTQIALGFDHSLSKQTKLFVNYIMLEDKFTSNGDFDILDEDFNALDSYSGVSATEKSEYSRLQFGIDHKF